MFDINGKVALVTGGASGIGLETVKSLLRNGIRGVTIADIDSKTGENSVKLLTEEFGTGKVIFVRTDVANKENFEDAFKQTVSAFNNIDILVNNAGIFNDSNYEKCVAINLTGVIHGIVLGMEKYIPQYRSGPEGVIINTASIAGVMFIPGCPIYSCTKAAVVTLTRSFGHEFHYERTKVKVVAVAPSFTDTNIIRGPPENFITPLYRESLYSLLEHAHIQKTDFVSESILNVIKEKESGSVWIVKNDKDFSEYVKTNIDL